MNGHASLNRIFRVVWNASLGVWQVASELTRGKGKTKSSRLGMRGLAKLSAGSILVLCHAGALAELPTGGQVTAGSGKINDPVNGHLVVNQSSDKMAIDWQSFSVGTGNSVQFIQPSAEAVALNRVLGGDPSVIRGTISANGRVVLLNPNGILFGSTSKVEVASLLASTLKMSNEDFMNGNSVLEGDSLKGITNQGQIIAKDGGFVALVAAKIENVGDIRVRGGEVLMGVGRKVRLDLGGPIKIEIDEAVVDGYIRNGGLVKAEGGTVVMTVKTAGELASFAINNEGIIEATSLARGDGGTIRLLGDGGTVANSGTLDASSANGKGGYVEVTGARVGILDGSMVDASGATGGGTVLLGGDYQGKNAAVDNAKLTFIGEGATVRANATREGDGGKVIVWSDDRTAFHGAIEARGGAGSGNGGFVEVSGKQFLDFQGTVDTSAAKGRNGTLLLDPTNLTIGNVGTSGWITNNSNTFGDFTDETNPNPAHDFSFLRVDVLLAALANNDITVQSACDAANCVGTITVKDAIAWSSGKALTLDATGSIYINADITSTGAAGTKGGDFIAKAASGDIQVNANITAQGGAASTGAGLAGGNVNLNAAAGSVVLASGTVINTGGSAAAAGSDAAGGAAGSITLNSTTGIELDNGDLLARGGAGDGSGANGVGGHISLMSTDGDISQNWDSQIVGGRLQLQTDSGSVYLDNGSNEIEAIAAASGSGDIYFSNVDTAGLTVTNVGGTNGVYTGGSGEISLSARNLQIDSMITSQNGSITLDADRGPQSGDFSGVVINTFVGTADGSIQIYGRGGDADGGNQAGVVLANGASVLAGGNGSIDVVATGGSGAAGGNHGLVIEGGGSLGAGGGLVTDGGSIDVKATGGSAGDDNNAVVFRDYGRIGTADGNQSVSIATKVGAGGTSTDYATDANGGYITTGSEDLTLESDTLKVKGDLPVSLSSTGALTVKSASTSFASPFKLSEFTAGFDVNGGGTSSSGLNNLSGLVIGKTGNTADIQIDQALDMNGGPITLTGGNVNLDQAIRANSLAVTASGDINQSVEHGSFTLNSASLNSGGDITLRGSGNSLGFLTATAADALIFDNGTNALALNGNLTAKTIGLNAGSISQYSGLLTADALKVTASQGDVSLSQSNKIGTLAAQVDNGSLTVNGAGMTNGLTIGTVDGLSGVTVKNNVTINPAYDLNIEQNISAGGTVAIYAANRDINLGTETAGQLSLTNEEINRIQASKLSLTTYNGMVRNSANVRAGGLDEIAVTAQGIMNEGSGQLGFSQNAGKLDLNSTGTADGSSGIGTSTSNRLITAGAKELVLTSNRQIHVDARTTSGEAGSANLDKLHITSNSAAASNSSFSVLSSAGLTLTTGTGPTWYRGENPAELGTYHLTLNNSEALDFKFVGNAPIQLNASSLGETDFALQTTYGINVAGNIQSVGGDISLKAGGSSGNFKGISLNGTSITTTGGNITLDGKGGTGQNTKGQSDEEYRNQSDQFGVWIAGNGSVSSGSGAINIIGQGGSTQSNSTGSVYGNNSDGVVLAGTAGIESDSGNIAIHGTGGSNYGDASKTSDGIVLESTGGITSASGSVKLTGKSGSGIYNTSSVAITQANGNITAAGLEVIATENGWAYLTNNNNVGTLAGDVRHGFAFDNGGRALTIGNVNGRAGFSDTSTSELGLYDIGALTVNESIEMTSGTLKIAADTISIAEDKHIGDKASNSSRNVNVWLTGRAENGQTSTRSIDIGTADGSALGFTSTLLDKIHARDLELATLGSITVTNDTDFTNISGLTLTGSAITNPGGHYLRLTSVDNKGSVSLNGSSIGARGAEIITRGADRISVSSNSNINVTAYTDEVAEDNLIQLRSLSINSTSGANGGHDYLVDAAGLTYAATGVGGTYEISANATDAPVDFSFRGNSSIAVTAGSDLKGGSFSATSTNGNVDVNAAITAGNVALDATSAVRVSNAAVTSSGTAWLEGDRGIQFLGTGSLTADRNITLRTTVNNFGLSTDAGVVKSNTADIAIETDAIEIGTGGMSAANGNITLNSVQNGRAVQLGGTTDGSELSLKKAELERMTAKSLTIGNGSQNDSTGAVTLVGDINLAGKIDKLSLRGYSGGVMQSGGPLTVDSLEISMNSGNLSLQDASNNIRTFSATTNGTVNLTNTGTLEIKSASGFGNGIYSNGKAISVTTSGNLLVSSAVNATANTTGTNVAGGAITLASTGGNLTVLGSITSDGYSSNSNSRQTGGTITLNGRNVELGAVTIQSRGSSNSGEGAVGGNAGAIHIYSNTGAGTITLDGTTINQTGGNGGHGTGSGAGAGGNFTFTNAVVLAPLSGSTQSTATINSGGGNVTFGSTVNGGPTVANNLTINTARNHTTPSYGNVTMGAIGGSNAIGKLTLTNVGEVNLQDVNAAGIAITNTATNSTGITRLYGNLRTNGADGININSKSIVLGANKGYTTENGGNIKLATQGSLNLANTAEFNSSGNIDLTATDGITVSGAALTTTGAGIIFGSNTTLASHLAIDTTGGGTAATGGNVEFRGTLNSTGGAKDLSITAGTEGDVKFNGQVGNTAQLGAVTINSADNVTTSSSFRAASFTQNASSIGGTTTIGGAMTLDGAFGFTGNALTVNQALAAASATVTNAGQFTTGSAGDITVGGLFTQNGAGKSVLAGDINTTNSNISFAAPVEFAGTMKLDTGTGAGDITFGGTLDSNVGNDFNTVTLNAGSGTVNFGGNVGSTQAVGNLVINSSADVTLPGTVNARSLTTDAAGSTIFQGSTITTSGAQTYGDAVTLAGDATLASTGSGNITFAGSVNGAHDLAVNTGGTTTFGGAVGGSTALVSLATNAGGTTVFNGGTVNTTGSQTYADNVQLGANTTFASTGGNAITFGGMVNSASSGNYALTVDTTGTTSFNGAVGAARALSSITTAQQQGTLLMNGGTFQTTGAQTYNSGTIILGGDTRLQSTGAGAITLGGNVDAAICTVASLDVLTQGATVFGGAIGTYRPLWSVTTDGLASVPGNTVSFNNGTVVTLADQTYGELAILGANTSLKSLGQGDIAFDGPVRAAVDGQQSLTVDTSGDIVFNGAVGDNDQRLASFDAGQSIDGKVQINGGGVNTAGTQVYRQQVALGNDAILTGTTGTFGTGVDADGNDLTLRFSGPTELEGAKFVNVRNLTSDGSGVTNITGTVETSGTQAYDSNVVLATDVVLKSTGTGADGDIALNGTVDGAHSLRIETEGTTDLSSTIGGTTALTSLSTDGPGVTTIGANVRTSGAQTYGDAVQMTTDAVLSSTNGGDIAFAGTVDGSGGLTVNTSGTTRFEDRVGGSTALASLTTDAGGSVVINGGGVTTDGAQTYGDAVTLGADTELTSTNGGDVRFNGTLDGAHNLTVNTDGASVFEGPVGGTTALASLSTDAGGTSAVNGGKVITTGAQTYGDGLTLGKDTNLISTNEGDIRFQGTVDGAHSLAVYTGGTTSFRGNVGGTTALTSLMTDAGGDMEINGGNITTTGAQTYSDAVTLRSDATLTSTQGGDIAFNATVDGPHELAVNTGGTTRFNAAVGGNAELASLATGGNGSVALNGGSVKTSGDQSYDSAVTLGANTVLTSSHDGDISFGKTLDGARDLAIATGGTTSFNGAVGGKTALASITTDADGEAVVNGGLVRTSGEQKFNDGVTIGANTTFASSGPITFVSTLDGPWDVTINTPSVATFGGAVGSVAPIANLKGGNGSGSFEFKGPSITATGSLTLEEAVHVKNKTVVKVGGDALFYGDAKTGKDLLDVTAGGRIQFGRPVDNFKNYLPTLFTLGTQTAAQNRPMAEVRTPVSLALVDDASSRQLGIGNLQVVNVTPTAAPAGGSTATQNVSESAVNQAVGQIAADESSRSTTYVVTVKGGVRVADNGLMEEGQ